MSDDYNSEIEEVPVFTMVDENGNSHDFEFLGEVEYQGRDFLISVEANETEDDVYYPIIIEILPDEDEVVYETITDENLIKNVYQLFKDENPEDFIYAD